MPVYVYETLDGVERYEFIQKISEDPFQNHPVTDKPIRRIIVPGAGIKIPGIKKGARINKRSPAATACGCAKGLHNHNHNH